MRPAVRRHERGAGPRAAALLTALTVTALGLSGCPADAPDARSEDPARQAPDFVLERLGGGEVRLADLRGKTVVLDFWATWCPPCEFQVPELNSFYDAHHRDGDVAVFGVSVDTEGPDVVAAWAAEKGVRYPILLGGDGLARKLGAMGFPTLYVIGPDGAIQEQHVGLIEAAILEQALSARRGDGHSS